MIDDALLNRLDDIVGRVSELREHIIRIESRVEVMGRDLVELEASLKTERERTAQKLAALDVRIKALEDKETLERGRSLAADSFKRLLWSAWLVIPGAIGYFLAWWGRD